MNLPTPPSPNPGSSTRPPGPTPLPRRDFIRLLAGGSIVAATQGLAGCSAALPSGAVAAWSGPAADTELRRWAVAWAILAPSSHNLQPWLVDLGEPGTITLRVDRERLLPETDPWFRQILVSQGCFIEALVLALAARGFAADVALFPEGAFAPRSLDDRPVARVTWRPGAARDPLFDALPRRRTSRLPFAPDRPVDPAALARVLDATRRVEGVQADGTLAAERVAALRDRCAQAARIEFGTARTMLESLRLTRVGPQEIDRHRDGVSLNTPVLRAAVTLGLFDRDQAPAPGSTAFERTVAGYEAQVRSAQGFVWLATPVVAAVGSGAGRVAEVQAGRAQLRLHLQATREGLRLHPLSQALQEFSEMQPLYEQVHAQLLGTAADRGTVQMLCRIGHAPDSPPAPRRGAQAVLRS